MIPEKLPYGAEIGADGVWRQVLTRTDGPGLRPALFLDRDGVIVEEVHYLHKVADMKLVPGAAETIRAANELGVPVVIVTNQAGIGRGIYGWPEFIAVQEAMLDAVADAGGFVNAVFACPHHGGGRPPYDIDNHPARKPNPGMLLAAAEKLAISLAGSWIVGDRAGDMAAGKRAGISGGVHVRSGHGRHAEERSGALDERSGAYDVLTAETIADAGPQIPLLGGMTVGAK